MSRKSLYNSKITVKRLNLSTQDDVGGIEQIKTTVFIVAGRIRQLTALEQPVGGKQDNVSTHRVYTSKIDIRQSDELLTGNRVYDVNVINPTSSDKGTIQIDCTLRT